VELVLVDVVHIVADVECVVDDVPVEADAENVFVVVVDDVSTSVASDVLALAYAAPNVDLDVDVIVVVALVIVVVMVGCHSQNKGNLDVVLTVLDLVVLVLAVITEDVWVTLE